MTQPGRAVEGGSVDEHARLHEFAHDLHNLLFVVVTYAQLARESLPEGHRADADMANIGDAAERAAALVNTFASLSPPHDRVDGSSPDVSSRWPGCPATRSQAPAVTVLTLSATTARSSCTSSGLVR